MNQIPKYLQKSTSRKRGRKGEKVVSDTINSGALWFDKSDKKSKNYLIEVKTTDKSSYRITSKLIAKLVDEAYTVKKEPRLVILLPQYILTVSIKIR